MGDPNVFQRSDNALAFFFFAFAPALAGLSGFVRRATIARNAVFLACLPFLCSLLSVSAKGDLRTPPSFGAGFEPVV